MTFEVRQVEDSDATAWDDFVASASDASFYHRYTWRSFFADTMAKKTYYLAAFSNTGSVVGVLPLVRLTSKLFGDFLVSLPYVNYGGPRALSEDILNVLYIAAGELAVDLGVDHVECRDTRAYTQWKSRTDKVAMIRELPATIDELSKSLGSKLRSQIRRPQRENPVVRKGGEDLLGDFYAVFCRNMRDLGTPVYAKNMFADIVARFQDESEIIVVSVGDVPAAAAFLFHANSTTEIPWASTVREFNPISINMLLYWECLQSAVNSGSTRFDFGRSSKDAGTYRFKKQWGAKPVPYNWNYWLRPSAEIPDLNPGSGKFDLAIKAWRKLPLWLANRIGPHIVKHLP